MKRMKVRVQPEYALWCVVMALFTVLLGCTSESGEPRPELVRMVYQHSMVTLDPHAHNDGVTGAVLSAVYQGLVVIKPGAAVSPLLASEWTTPDDNTWHFRLRPDVRFHDGSELSIEDVVESFHRARFAPQSSLATYMDGILDVRPLPDDLLSFEITTTAPFPLLLSRIAMVAIVPAGFDPEIPTGTGPYRWVSGDETETIRLETWQGFWGNPAEVPAVTVEFLGTDEEILKAVNRGRVDVLGKTGLDFLEKFDLSAVVGDWRAVRNPAATTTMLGLNITRGPLADPAIRRAIDLVLDREDLVETVFDGKGAVAAYSIIPEEVFGARPRTSDGIPDVEQAQALVAAAGIPEGSPIKLQHGRVTALVVENVVDRLEVLGFSVEVEDLPYDVFYRRLENAELEAFIFGWNFHFNDASDFLDAMAHTRDPERQLGDTNGTSFSDPKADELIEAAAREPIPERRLQQLREAIEILGRERPYLPLYHAARQAIFKAPFTMTQRPGSWLQPQEIRYR